MNKSKELDRYWDDTLFDIASGDPVRMASLKRYDIFEFFSYMEKEDGKRRTHNKG
ncbi:MAG: hypothetical protein ABFC18_03090 [Rikenellaceae bacterium]